MVKLLSLAAACIGACAFAGTGEAQTVVPTLTGETLLSGVFAGGSGSTVVTSESASSRVGLRPTRSHPRPGPLRGQRR
jgi:hypothetical protein